MNFLPCNNFLFNKNVELKLRVLCVGFVSLGTALVYPENDSRNGFSSTIIEVQNRESSNTFHGMSPDKTGVTFVSQVDEWEASQNRVLYNGAGVAVGDYDRDGWPDFFICSIDGKSVLYKNNGDWVFVDTTVTAGLGKMGHRHRGAVFADLNGDSWLDLLVGTVGMGVRIFINHEGVFEETTDDVKDVVEETTDAENIVEGIENTIDGDVKASLESVDPWMVNKLKEEKDNI